MNSRIRIFLVLTLGLLAVVFFFRLTVFSGFDYIPGDVWDGRLLFGIVDHWRQFFAGECAWNDLRIFWPVENTLAYSDTFFLQGVPYAILCALGVDQLIAYALVFMGQAYVGYLSMYWLLNRFFDVRWGWAAAFAALFVNLASMQLSIDSSHLQMTMVWFCPLFVGMLWRALQNGRRAVLWAVGAAALLAAMFFSAYYMTWFMVFFLCIMAVIWILAGIGAAGAWNFRGRLVAVLTWLRARWLVLAAFAATFVVGIVPFLVLYLPASRLFGNRRFSEVLKTLPGPEDFINVGTRNLVWGWVARSLGLGDRPYFGELEFGITPVLFACFFFALISLALRLSKPEKAEATDAASRMSFLVGAAVLVSWILLFRVDGHSLWYFVLHCVPGAGAMRAIFRMNLLVASAVLVVIAVGIKGWDSGWRRWALVAVVSFFFAEQFSTPRADARFTRSAHDALFARIAPPPEDARVFLMLPDFEGGADMVQEHMTALLVAGRFGLSSVNGHSGQLPPGWNLDLQGTRYYSNAAQWIADGGLTEGIYGLDAATGKWTSQDFVFRPAAYVPGTQVVDRACFDRYAGAGWSEVESWGVWTNGTRAHLRFALPEAPRAFVVAVNFHTFNPQGTPQRVAMSINGREVGLWSVREGEHRQERFLVSASELVKGNLEILLATPDAPSVHRVKGVKDERILGVGMESLIIEAAE